MGYTKHYYAGSERIGTVFGGGGLADMEPTIGTDMISSDDRVVGFWSSYDQFFPFNGDAYKSDRPKEDIQSCCEATSLEKVQVESYHHEDLYDMLHANQYVVAHEDEVYFTHTDHLGSACWITNKKGEPIQYMHYAPYGELMANQQAQGYSYDERFKFTGKERDGESGYDYYGARYYTHLLGIWLSVDPLADKYLHVTPYIFCGGNPIMLVDPDGRENQSFFADDEKSKNLSDNSLATNFPSNDPRLNIFCHGLQGYLQMWDGEEICEVGPGSDQGLESLEMFDMFLKGCGSILWEEQGEQLEVVLHACYGADVAKALSEKYPEVIFVGATQENHAKNGVHSGVYTDYPIPNEDGTMGIYHSQGQWIYYKNGIEVKSTEQECPPSYYNNEQLK